MNIEHKKCYEKLLEQDKTHHSDNERKALFYIISGNSDLLKKAEHIYDFKDHSIKIEALGYTAEQLSENREMGEKWMDRCNICELPLEEHEYHACTYCEALPDFCSSSRKLIRLAFNLYNGYEADVVDTFSILDYDNFNLAINAIKIRFNKGE